MQFLRRRRAHGFTLIELMIVIAIIAVLVAILVPNFLKARAQSQLSACESSLKTLSNSLELYAQENDGHYIPGDISSASGYGPYLTPKYIGSVPTCPASGTQSFKKRALIESLAAGPERSRHWTWAAWRSPGSTLSLG